MSSDLLQGAWTPSLDIYRPQAGKTVVFFKTEQIPQKHESEQQKRPIFKEVVHIVKVPADQYLRIVRPVTEEDKEEYPQEWAQWERTHESRALGYPIQHWAAISDTQKAEFMAMNITTVEQLATMPDVQAQKFMGMAEIRQKAKVFLTAGKDAELIGEIRKEAHAEVTAMREKMEKMEKLLESLTAPGKK